MRGLSEELWGTVVVLVKCYISAVHLPNFFALQRSPRPPPPILHFIHSLPLSYPPFLSFPSFFISSVSTDGVRLSSRVLQVSRGVWVLQPEDMLAAASRLPAGGRCTQGALRWSCCHAAQWPWQAGAAERALQPTWRRRLGLPGVQPRLLPAEPEYRLTGNSGSSLQQDVRGHGRLRAHVLWSRLRPIQGPAGGALPLQIPLVLLCQVQALHSHRRPLCLQVREE